MKKVFQESGMREDFKTLYLFLHLPDPGLKMWGARSRGLAPLNSPVAMSNFCREPKDVLVSIHNISWYC